MKISDGSKAAMSDEMKDARAMQEMTVVLVKREYMSG